MTLDANIVAKLGLSPADGRLSGGGLELSFNCIFCTQRGEPTPDNKRRLMVHIAKDSKFGLAYCFRCQFKAFLATTNKNGSPSVHVVFGSPQQGDLQPPPVEALTLPTGCVDLVPQMSAYEYITGRGVSDDDVSFYNLKYFRGRVVFPDYLDDQLIYWVGRSVTGREPKYKNCRAPRTDKLYNLGRFLKLNQRTLVVVEGPISAISAGRDAVATYGKGFSEEQVRILRNLPLDRIYVALDPDAKRDALHLASALCNFIPEVYLVNVPDREDPNSLGTEKFRALLQDSLRYEKSDVGGHLRFLLE
jgi:hypothetical protein